MRSTSRKFLLAAAGLFILPLSLQASVDSIMKMELKYFVQQKFGNSGSNKFGTVRIVRLDSKQLITLLAKQTKQKYPSGAELKVSTTGQVAVVDAKGKLIGGASPYIKAKLALKKSLFDGKYNGDTGKETSNNYYRFTLTLDLPGLTGTVAGTAVENYKISGADSDGIQITTGKTEILVNGKGTVDGKPALYDGSLYLKGREAVLQP